MVKKAEKEKVETEKEIENVEQEELSEKELLKQAEEREKERKAQEEIEKAEQKEEEKAKKVEEREERAQRKTQVRVKPRHGKKYIAIAEKIEKGKEYPVTDAINLSLETSPAKFDATIELHIRLNAKEKNIRGMVVLPGGLVKEKKIAIAEEKNVDELVADIKAGKINFDVLIADIKVMSKLAQLAKILGPKGLMPSPKAGTVVEDIEKAVEELKSGKVEYRADKLNIVHMPIGKISFGFEKIKENYDAVLHHMPKKIESIYLSTTMGPSIKVSKK